MRAVRTVSLRGVSDTCRHQERACVSFPWFLIEGGPEDPDSFFSAAWGQPPACVLGSGTAAGEVGWFPRHHGQAEMQ